MRIYIKPPDFDTGDWYEKTCRFIDCKPKTYYSDNPNSVYCCDSHRAKAFYLNNKQKNDELKDFKKKFGINYEILKRLYSLGFFHTNQRELTMSGFDFNIKGLMRKVDGLMSYEYHEYIIILKGDKTYQIINKNIDHDNRTIKH